MRCCLGGCHSQGALSIQPKIPEILVSTSNGTDHFSLVQQEYLGPALRVVRFDQSGHFGQSDRNVPFHLTKLLFPVLLFCILLTRVITKLVVAWVRSVQPEYTVLLGKRNFRNLKQEFFVQIMESTHGCDGHEPHLAYSFLAPQASQASHPTLVFKDEFKLHYNSPYAKKASDQHLPLSGQVSYFADEGTLVKQNVSQNSCNVCFVV